MIWYSPTNPPEVLQKWLDCFNLLSLSGPLPSSVYLSLSPSLVADCYITTDCVYMTVIAKAPPVPSPNGWIWHLCLWGGRRGGKLGGLWLDFFGLIVLDWFYYFWQKRVSSRLRLNLNWPKSGLNGLDEFWQAPNILQSPKYKGCCNKNPTLGKWLVL